jgi:hypothetical protein
MRAREWSQQQLHLPFVLIVLNVRRETAQTNVQDGTSRRPTIVYGILRYKSSEMMLQRGLGALVGMTYALSTDTVGETLQRWDFLEKIPSLVSIHNAYLVSSNAAVLFLQSQQVMGRLIEI